MGMPEPYRYSHTIGFFADMGHRGFNNPVDIALAPNGIIYVLNRGDSDTEARMSYKRVTMCTIAEDYLGQFGSGGSGEGQMMWPVAIAAYSLGHLYISDEALHRISVFDDEGRFLSSWGVKGDGPAEFDGPAGITFDTDETLLVVDSVNNRVQRYTRDGRFLDTWGRQGRGDGEFNLPWGICVDRARNVYVADWRNDRIQKFDSDGNHLSTWGTSGHGDREFYRPSGLAVDEEGHVLVADWGNERVQALGPDGRLLASFQGEGEVSRWAQEFFEASPEYLEERRKADLEPEPDPVAHDYLRDRSGSIEKLFWGPISVMTDQEGRMYVVESCRHRIQVYTRQPQRARELSGTQV